MNQKGDCILMHGIALTAACRCSAQALIVSRRPLSPQKWHLPSLPVRLPLFISMTRKRESKTMSAWQTIDTAPRGELVMTKIHDEEGERNVTALKSPRNGRLWFLPDGTVYVYYTPTHWRPMGTASDVGISQGSGK